MIVSDVPGTTRDAIDTVLERDDRTFVLVDTAGLRRKRQQRQGIEYYSELRALEAAERADVALVLVDATEGVVDQDLAVADVARKARLLDARRPLEVGRYRDRRSRTCAPRLERACASGRRSSRSRRRPAAGSTALLETASRALREAHGADPDAGAEPLPRRAARGAPAAVAAAASGSTCSTAPRSRRARRASASS